ncbi:MAG: class I SAM-dependent methyltransferase [Chitinophagaceae bacterium]|nr:class I SAM-dependent methyltransferase [Chitinophagaceae bacterium]MCW5905755.1 class I SAM-dependent methyltransferase [Chitinophagaceae bacterium]
MSIKIWLFKIRTRIFGTRNTRKTLPFTFGKIFSRRYNTLFSSTYLSYIPDRYLGMYQQYRKKPNPFFDENDIEKWQRGNYINNSGDLPRFYFLNLVIDQLLHENIQGAAAELGVYKGNSAFLFQKYVTITKQKLYLFDTFEGFNNNDLVGLDKQTDTTMFTDVSLNEVKNLVDTNNVEYVVGYFPDSLSKVDNNENLKFSVVHIDCDLELPFKHALEYFYPKLVPGGFLIMHDYFSLHWQGAIQTMDAFFTDKPEKLIPVPDKSGTAVIRKTAR